MSAMIIRTGSGARSMASGASLSGWSGVDEVRRDVDVAQRFPVGIEYAPFPLRDDRDVKCSEESPERTLPASQQVAGSRDGRVAVQDERQWLHDPLRFEGDALGREIRRCCAGRRDHA